MESVTENPVLTIAVIAKNEENNLPALFRSLEGLPSVSQILLVDTGSSDNTRGISLASGAEVHDYKWQDDFSAARNYSLALSKGQWILWLDADDELPAKTMQWLQENINQLDPKKAYTFQIRSPESGGTQCIFSQIRLFPNYRGIIFQNVIHESLGMSIQKEGIDILASGLEILHTGYRDPGVVEKKRQRNFRLMEKAMSEGDEQKEQPSTTLKISWGKMLMAEARWHDAQRVFERLLENNPDLNFELESTVRIYLGQCFGFQSRYQEALAIFEFQNNLSSNLNITSNKPNAAFLLEYGKALWHCGKVLLAREAWSKCLTAAQDIGAIPTDWDTVIKGAQKLLAETKPKIVPNYQPTIPPNQEPNAPEYSLWLNLSVCSILKNEAENLPGLIQSLPLSRIEWVVLDTGSEDSTIELIRQAGVEPKTFSWKNDFSEARNESLRHAKRDWILWLDGDDRLDEDFWDAIHPLLGGPKQGYRFIIRSPREASYGEQFRQVRLFPNHLGIEFEGRIHEQLGTSLQKLAVPILDADLKIVHIGYNTKSKRQAKQKRNQVLLEQEILDHPEDSTVGMEYGNCLYQNGNFSGAKKIYLKFMPNTDPLSCLQAPQDEVLGHFPSLLGETCLQLHEFSEAQAWYHLATRWNPADLQPFYWLGKKTLESQNIKGALEYFYATLDRPVRIGRLATDNYTIRRNALAFVFLCELQLFGANNAPRAKKSLKELIDGGLQHFPLEYQAPWDYYLEIKSFPDAEKYALTYLKLFPKDKTMWENFLEFLLISNRHREMQALFNSIPDLILATGVLEAFRGKVLEIAGTEPEIIYHVYHQALRTFPCDPTLLVYFSEFVNKHNLYKKCYVDLKALPSTSEPVQDFLRQIKAQGLVSVGEG